MRASGHRQPQRTARGRVSVWRGGVASLPHANSRYHQKQDTLLSKTPVPFAYPLATHNRDCGFPTRAPAYKPTGIRSTYHTRQTRRTRERSAVNTTGLAAQKKTTAWLRPLPVLWLRYLSLHLLLPISIFCVQRVPPISASTEQAAARCLRDGLENENYSRL